MTALELRAVEKWYGDVQVIKGVDLEVREGEFVVFVGPSGCGKSTLLRMIAGLEDISRGSVHIKGEDMTAQPASARGLAMVFQSYALYPHMSVRDNMGFSLKMAGRPQADITAAVDEAARVLRLESYLDRRPKDLSGGQRQRVAIGRSIVRSPTAFLFDEPLSNLDAALRVEMRQEIAKLHDTLGAAMVYVTHDQVEAMTLADRIVVLRDGRIEQIGAPRELYERPANTFVAQFIGSPKMNLLPCERDGDRFRLPGNGGGPAPAQGDIRQVGIRPEAITLCEPGTGHCDGTLDMVEYLGSDSYVMVDRGGPEPVLARLPGGTPLPATGTSVGLRFEETGLHFFDVDGLAIR